MLADYNFNCCNCGKCDNLPICNTSKEVIEKTNEMMLDLDNTHLPLTIKISCRYFKEHEY